MRKDAMEIFQAGVESVEPAAAVKAYCDFDGAEFKVNNQTYDLAEIENIYIVGAGKAAAPMARALEEILQGRVREGTVNVKYGHLTDLEVVRIKEAGHPLPDQGGVEGTKEILELAKRATEKDLVFCVLSGGGSALLPMPVSAVSFEEKQETTKVLLACGATIHEINAVRKHISQVKGGGLARAVCPARLISLILSDVVGDNLDAIASGPTVADHSTFQDCLDVFDRYGIRDKVPSRVLKHIIDGREGRAVETPKPGDPVFKRTQNLIVGSNLRCVLAAKKKAQEIGYRTMVLSTMIEGETKDVAKVHAAIAKEVKITGNPIERPACILSGGETTVTIIGDGLGGRNQEFVLVCAMEIQGLEGTVVLSGGTDGTDGPTDAAGAIADGSTLDRAEALDMSASDFLKRNDSYHFFQKLNDLLITGPTNTNVMDLRLIMVS